MHDAGRAWKVDVAARYAERLGLETQVRCLRGHLGSEVSAPEIEECDISFSCVDKHLPRAILNRLVYEKAIPLIDRAASRGTIKSGTASRTVSRLTVAVSKA